MKSFFILCLIICMFTAAPAHAQHWHTAVKHAEKTLQRNIKQYNGNVEKALHKNITRAQAVHQAFARTNYFAPTFSLGAFTVKEPIGQYTTPMVYGWTMDENNLFISQRIIYERHIRQLLKKIDFFQHNKIQMPAGMPAKKLAALIPADKKYIFMGEYHYQQITKHLMDALTAFVQLYPDKKIIVFSEFADEWGFEQSAGNPSLMPYIQPLEKAGITWVGLKEPAPLKTAILSDEYNMPVQATLKGIKARNTHWLSILKQWRKEHPDALFIIHAGGGHTDYQEAFSVSARFPAEETFVLEFIPYFNGFSQYALEPFHHATNYIFYRPGILRWQTPRAAHLAGFDMQVMIP